MDINQFDMKNNYYVPNLNEFHISFEYEEYLESNAKFVSLIISEEDLFSSESKYYSENQFNNIKIKILENKIRVKYLSIKDITNLGFKQTPFNFYS